MTNERMIELLGKQLELLAEHSGKTTDTQELLGIVDTMCLVTRAIKELGITESQITCD